ncbi:hypothetical protein [Streptomyces spirodelae]|uniref:Colicin D immunity protein domain-containing protein n=1 Tax=Streptomyces spirodelae TaxID=2812904 RepID=A0ABS3WVC3_9ACTN|nr:hypothetical protein [Streptomyces spirodelae]MBO8187085.1 hypothetical protein [Streptomyces spirodelae]
MNAKAELLSLIDVFLSGEDQSISLINSIEGILVENFPESLAFEELAEPLSLFRPGCGSPYYDVQDMREALQEASDSLNYLE